MVESQNLKNNSDPELERPLPKYNNFGGKRKGAGRPKGSQNKPNINRYLNEEEVKSLVKKAKELAAKGDSTMLKFLLEQIFGKAPQTIAADVDVKATLSLAELFRNSRMVSVDMDEDENSIANSDINDLVETTKMLNENSSKI